MLLRVDGGPWRQPSGSGYSSEAALQTILADHPALVPGVSADAIVCREFQSGVGPADLVTVDPEGTLTLVECKLAANPQVRREVIGQVLDYASRLWQMPIAAFEAQWTARTGESPFAAMGDDQGLIRATVEANLLVSRFRIVLAVDAINDDLRRIVEYLNAITVPTTAVIAVEFLRVHDGPVEILTPRTYGEELADIKQAKDPGARRQWSVQDYRDWLAASDPTALPALTALLAALESRGFAVNGGRASTPSMNASIEIAGIGRKWPLCFYTYDNTGAVLEVRFIDFKTTPDVAERYLQAASGFASLPIDTVGVRVAEYRKRPNLPLRAMSVEDVEAFADAIGAAFAYRDIGAQIPDANE